MDMTQVLERIERRLKKLGLSASTASLKATGSKDTIRNWQRAARAGKSAGASTRSLVPLAEVLETTPAWLIDGDGDEEGEARTSASEFREVVVAAHVQAGYWAETWEWGDDEKYAVMVPNEPELQAFTLYAAETRGPSMNRRYPPGTVVVFTNAAETEEPLEPGKRYVVERKRASGEAEHTVKTLHRDESGSLWLIPESTDPLYQTPISVNDGAADEDEVRIIGRVRWAVSRE
jgi:SOS-response transcriptional repressor LexA